MGKGDKKSKRGKIVIGSFGVRRSKKKKKTIPAVKNLAEPKPKKSTPEKVAAVIEPAVDVHVVEEAAKKAAVKKAAKKVAEGGEEKPKAPKTKKKGADETPAETEAPKQE
jgi:30S ribosomal protein S31